MALPNTVNNLSIKERNKEMNNFLEYEMTKYEDIVLKRVCKNMKNPVQETFGSDLLHELVRLADIAMKHFKNELN